MPEHPIRTMFDQIAAEPDGDFVAELRRRVLVELSEALPVEEPRIARGTDHRFEFTAGQRRAPTASRDLPDAQQRRRRLAAVLLAAAIVSVVAVGLVSRKAPSHRIVPSTKTEPTMIGFSSHVLADFKTPDGYSFHFEGTVILPPAIESDENNMPVDQSDILFIPSISGTLTNTTGTAAPLARVSVQLFLRADAINCIANSGPCEPAIIRELINGRTPSSVASGASVTLVDSGDISRSRVRRGDVPAILSQARDGTLVTGMAVVVAGGTEDQLATEILDPDGKTVLSCSREPSDCMDASRSVLDTSGNPSAVSVPGGAASADSVPPPFPPGEIPPGTYSVDRYVLTTYGNWRVYSLYRRSLIMARDDTALPGFGIIDQPLSLTPTTDDAIAQICAKNSVAFGQPTQTTFFGTTAVSVEGEVIGQCVTPVLYPLAPTANSHVTIRIVAAEVNGSMLTVFAYAPTDQWPTFSKELDATIASLRIL